VRRQQALQQASGGRKEHSASKAPAAAGSLRTRRPYVLIRIGPAGREACSPIARHKATRHTALAPGTRGPVEQAA
jgi:hypothetical protein